MITILPEIEAFYSAIHAINVLAFGRNNEAKLIESPRKLYDFVQEISFVAIKKGRVVGHILFNRITIQTENGTFSALTLEPMAIHSEFQNQGIGLKHLFCFFQTKPLWFWNLKKKCWKESLAWLSIPRNSMRSKHRSHC